MKAGWKKVAVTVVASLCVLIAAPILVQRRHILNYTDAQSRSKEGSYADSAQAFDGTLRVVTWNLHFGENLDRILATLESASELQEADFLLLQEIDAEGVEKLAKTLRYDYCFVPTVYSRQRRKEYGIAILSKWPLMDCQRISLPNWFPGWIENRYAMRTIASVAGAGVAVYTVHMDVLRMEPQGQFLAEEMTKEANLAILGGDFNTWRPSSISSLENEMAKIGMERLTKGTGYTFESSGLQFTLDHIFSSTGLEYSAGVYQQTNASDHYPVWAAISIDTKP